MRTKMKGLAAETRLTRLLNALELELIEASEEEILAAAKALGMDPTMKGSAAFMGLKYFVSPKLSDFFDMDLEGNLRGKAGRIESATRPPSRPDRKDPDDE